MQKILFIFNFKRFPLATAIALGLLLATEVFVRVYSSSFMPLADYLMFYKRDRMMMSSKPYANAVIIGDSRAMGLDAHVLSYQLSGKLQRSFEVYNYAIPGFGAEGYYLFLEKYLKNNQNPEIIFLSERPLILAGHALLEKNPEHSHKHRFFSFFSMSEYRKVVSAKFFWKNLLLELREHSVLITYRASIERFLRNIFSRKVTFVNIDKRPIIESMNGGYPLEGTRVINEEDIHQSFVWQNDFNVDVDALFWYEKFLQLAKDRQIKVVILNMPLVADVFIKREGNGSNARYREIIYKLTNKYNLQVIEPLLESYDRIFFADTDHLNNDGNKFFLNALLQKIDNLKLEGN